MQFGGGGAFGGGAFDGGNASQGGGFAVDNNGPDANKKSLNKQSLMPADPARQLSRDNAVLVPSAVRKHLLKACRDGGRARYLETLAALR